MLTGAGYNVETRADHEVSEALAGEGTFDLLILAFIEPAPKLKT